MVACILQESIQQDSKTDEAGVHEGMIELHAEIKEAEATDHGTMVQEDDPVRQISANCSAKYVSRMDITTYGTVQPFLSTSQEEVPKVSLLISARSVQELTTNLVTTSVGNDTKNVSAQQQ